MLSSTTINGIPVILVNGHPWLPAPQRTYRASVDVQVAALQDFWDTFPHHGAVCTAASVALQVAALRGPYSLVGDTALLSSQVRSVVRLDSVTWHTALQMPSRDLELLVQGFCGQRNVRGL